jgi:biopolymer transport protein TolR
MQGPSQGGGQYKVMADMNMIPFIDICLVLLIIFMVMTPMLVQSQIKVDLPKSKAGDQIPQAEKIVDVQILSDGAILIDGRRVPADSIDQVLTRKLPDPKNQSVMIQADKSVKVEQLVFVMGSVRKLGCTKMGVAVKSEREVGGR